MNVNVGQIEFLAVVMLACLGGVIGAILAIAYAVARCA